MENIVRERLGSDRGRKNVEKEEEVKTEGIE